METKKVKTYQYTLNPESYEACDPVFLEGWKNATGFDQAVFSGEEGAADSANIAGLRRCWSCCRSGEGCNLRARLAAARLAPKGAASSSC